MNNVFEFSPSKLAPPLIIATVVVVVALCLQRWRWPHLLRIRLRIGLRNLPRRKLRTALVLFGLMLATTFVAAAIAIDDTVVLAVKTVAGYNLGRIDEQVTRRGGSTEPFPAEFGGLVRDSLASNAHVAGIGAPIAS
jgi:putative ABC transport system permease protein